MKKICIFLFTALMFLSFNTVISSASFNENEFAEKTQDELFSILDSETAEALEEIGIDGLDFRKIYNVSFSNIAAYFSDNLSQKFHEALNCLMVLIGVVMITAAVRIFAGEGEDNFGFTLVCLMIITLFTISKLTPVINTILSVINLSAKFMLSYIPIFAGIIAFSGNPASALTYNTVTLAFAEGISAFSNKFAVSAIGAFYCLSVSFSVNRTMNLSRFVSAFSKAFSVVFGLIASLFTGLISIRGIMSAGVDTVSSKGIRFIIGSMIPVVGGAISDAYSAIVGSLGLIKGSVAVFGIIAGLVINIPAVAQTLSYFLILSVVSFFAEALGMNEEATLLKAFSVGIKFLLLILIYEMFILLISTGLMITLKGAA